MRAVLWLLLSAAVWYLAGLYQMEMLGLLFLTQLLLFGMMLLL